MQESNKTSELYAPVVLFDVRTRRHGRKGSESRPGITGVLAVMYAPDGQLTYVNEAYCRYYGMDRETLIGRNFMQHRVPMDDLLRISRAVSTLSPLAPQSIVSHEVVLRDGRVRRHIWLHKAVFDADGGLRGFLAAGVDVTETAEESLEAEMEGQLTKHVNSLHARAVQES